MSLILWYGYQVVLLHKQFELKCVSLNKIQLLTETSRAKIQKRKTETFSATYFFLSSPVFFSCLNAFEHLSQGSDFFIYIRNQRILFSESENKSNELNWHPQKASTHLSSLMQWSIQRRNVYLLKKPTVLLNLSYSQTWALKTCTNRGERPLKAFEASYVLTIILVTGLCILVRWDTLCP